MKFICTTEPFRHFRGLLFRDNKPRDVTDRATIALLLKHPDFKLAEEVTHIPDVCSKCGKTVKRGKYMHQKWCQGK